MAWVARRAILSGVRLLVTGCAAMLLGGCSSTVTRHATVDPAQALALGARAEVVAVNGRAASGSVAKDDVGYFLVGPRIDRRDLSSSSDKLTVEISYEDGEVIPHEGVVGTRPKAALLTASVVLLTTGVLLGTVGFIGADQPPPACPPDQWFCFEPDFRAIYVGLGILGGVSAATGIGFLIAGALTPVRILHVALAPIVSPTTTGGALAVSF